MSNRLATNERHIGRRPTLIEGGRVMDAVMIRKLASRGAPANRLTAASSLTSPPPSAPIAKAAAPTPNTATAQPSERARSSKDIWPPARPVAAQTMNRPVIASEKPLAICMLRKSCAPAPTNEAASSARQAT